MAERVVTMNGEEPAPPSGLMRDVCSWFRPSWRELALSALLLVVLAILAVVQPLLLRRVIDDALPHSDTALLVGLGAAMIAAGALSTGGAIFQAALFTKAAQRLSHDLRLAVYDEVSCASIPDLTRRNETASLSRIVGDIGVIDDEFAIALQSVAWSASLLVSLSATMLIVSWPLTIISIALGTGLALITRTVSRKQFALGWQRQEALQRMMKFAGENLSVPGIILGRTFRRVKDQREQFAAESRTLARLRYQQRLVGRTTFSLMGLAFSVMPPLIYVLSGTLLRGVTLGSVVVVATLQSRLSAPLQELLTTRGTLQSSFAAFGRVLSAISVRPGQRADTPVPAQPRHRFKTAAPLVVENLRYRYPDAAVPVLVHVEASFAPGTITFIRGETGSGKSTLAMLLAGLISPQHGQLGLRTTADGPLELAETCIVPQESVLFNASVRDNLRFACPTATDADLMAVLRDMALEHIVQRSPEGLDSTVGERGYQVSGGERQRFALARALLRDAQVLVLDEATSALDHQTAERVFSAVRRRCRERIVIAVAHRLPATEGQDRVLVLGHGALRTLADARSELTTEPATAVEDSGHQRHRCPVSAAAESSARS